jgi:hypothetical protein
MPEQKQGDLGMRMFANFRKQCLGFGNAFAVRFALKSTSPNGAPNNLMPAFGFHCQPGKDSGATDVSVPADGITSHFGAARVKPMPPTFVLNLEQKLRTAAEVPATTPSSKKKAA